jgi:pyruvate dehydrogenase E1 component alpha subunit
MTYRYSGHSRADPAKYRPAGELEEWMKRDPIALYRARLLELGLPEDALREMEGAVQRAVDEATEAAKASPPATVDVIDRDVWADGGSSWRN